MDGKLKYVFVQDSTKSLGKPFYRTSVTNKTWRRAVRLAGLPSWVRFHSLRHTFVSAMHSAGIPQMVVEAIVGHNTKSVNDMYKHVNDSQIKDAIKALPMMETSGEYIY